MRVVKVLKIMVVLVFIAVVAVISFNLATHSERRLKVPQTPKKRDLQKIDKKEKVEFFEARGKRGNLQIKAEKHYLGEDDYYHLEGNVEIVFLDKSEGEDIYVNGDEVVYDPELERFQFVDKSKVRFKDLTLDVTALEYISEKKVFKSDYPVSFSSEKLTGSGRKMAYLQKLKKLKIDEGVHLEMMTNLSPTTPIILKGNTLEFVKRGKRGKLLGNVQVMHGESRITAEAMDFQLTGEGENIKYMHFTGGVDAVIHGENAEEDSSQGGTALHLYSAKREAKAEEITVHGIPDLPQIRQVLGKEDCVFTFYSDSGLMTQIVADSVDFTLNRQGKLSQFSALGKARISEEDDKGKLLRVITGEEMIVEKNSDSLTVSGGDASKATVVTPDADIKATEISFMLNNNNLEAKEDVKAIFTRESEENRPVGFFSADQPVFISTEKMRYSETQKRFIFSGGNKLWQQKQMLFTEELSFTEETGNINARGKVRALFPYTAEEGEEEIVEVVSETMFFDSDKQLAQYEGNSMLKVKDIRVRAESIFVHLSKEDGGMKKVTALERVVIAQGESQGRGEKAVFNVKKDTIILTGNPVLIDKDQGKTEGVKLTFFIADGKIVVENKDRERSVTVIKS
jgi:lipopolysaccharide transport protein LptA